MWRVVSREQCYNIHIFLLGHTRRLLSKRTRSHFTCSKTSLLTHWPLGDVAVILSVILQLIWWINILHNSCEVALRWMPVNTFDDKSTLRWRHNGRHSVSNYQPRDCLLNRLFRRRSKKTLKLRVTCLCAGNSPGTGEFPAQMANNAENVSIWWRHHDIGSGYSKVTSGNKPLPEPIMTHICVAKWSH